MSEDLLRRISNINALDDVIECYNLFTSQEKREKYFPILLFHCINLNLSIPEEFFRKRFLYSEGCLLLFCLQTENLEYFKFLLSRSGKESFYRVLTFRALICDASKILTYCIENDIPFDTSGLKVSHPATIEVLEKFKIIFKKIDDNISHPDIEFHSGATSFFKRNIPYVDRLGGILMKKRDVLEFIPNLDAESLSLDDVCHLNILFCDATIFPFLQEEEYEIIFDKMATLGTRDDYPENNFNKFLCDNLCLLSVSQEDFLIRDHLPWLQSNIEAVIRSGKTRLIEAIRD